MLPFSKHFIGLAPPSAQSPSPSQQLMSEILGNSAPADLLSLDSHTPFPESQNSRKQNNLLPFLIIDFTTFAHAVTSTWNPLLNMKFLPLFAFCPNWSPISRLYFSALFQGALGILDTTRSMAHAGDVNPLGHLRKDRHSLVGALPGT